MATPVTRAAGVNTPPQRKITSAEVQKFLSDAWAAMNMRLRPGILANESYGLIDAYAVQNYKPLLQAAYKLVFTDYAKAVETQADAYFQSAKALMFTPATPNQGTFDPLYLHWTCEHPVVEKRRKLVHDNQFAAKPVTEKDFIERSHKDDEVSVAKAKAFGDNQKAAAEIERAIVGLKLQGPHGAYNYPKMDEVQAMLRQFVATNLKPDGSNAVKILVAVKDKIAKAHNDNERANERWNSR
jgi:hypothetical protein